MITINGECYESEFEEAVVVAIEMWYDRHYKHWVIYPVDAEGNQMAEARYGFGRKEAMMIKADLENDYNI